jgi:O-antigen/teichoic acid export membrane protein
VFARVILVQIFNLIAISIIARKLAPSDFGVVAIATILITFLNNVISQGVSQFVIYDSEGSDERLNSAFWLNLLISLVIVAVGFVLSPFISDFYNEPKIQLIINLLLIRVPLESVIVIIDASFNKKLEFKILEKRDIFVQLLSISISIVMALNGFGVWSLIIPGIIVVFIRFSITLYISKWKPKLRLDITHWREIFSYSSKIIASSVINFFISEGDTLIIGKIMGSYKLGIYNLAWRGSNLVSRNIVSLVNKMSFPYIASSAGNNFEVLVKINKIFRILSIITFPILFLLIILAEEFILGIYGSQWYESIIPFQILLIYAIRYSVGAPIGAVYKSIGRPDINLKIGLSMIPFYILGIIIGTSYGIIGVAIGVTIVRTFFGFISFFILGKILNTRVWTFFRQMRSSFIATLITSLIIFVLKHYCIKTLTENYLLSLFVLFGIGLLLFLIILKSFFKDTFNEIEIILKKMFNR